MTNHNSSHRQALEKIALHPEKFGIPKPICSAIETNLFHSGKLIAQPDIIFYCINRDVYIIEYKSNTDGQFLIRASNQLKNATFWFAKYTDVDVDKIHTKIITGGDLKSALK